MARYQIWNKTDDIITPSGAQFTAAEWADRYPWAKLPGVRMIITAPPINGGAALEFGAAKAQYRKMGAAITDDMTDDEVLAAIEDFEDNPPGASEPGVEERTAAALEAQVLMMTPAEMSEAGHTGGGAVGGSPAYNRVKRNYDRGLWPAALVNAAQAVGQINAAEAAEILGCGYSSEEKTAEASGGES